MQGASFKTIYRLTQKTQDFLTSPALARVTPCVFPICFIALNASVFTEIVQMVERQMVECKFAKRHTIFVANLYICSKFHQCRRSSERKTYCFFK